MASLHRVATAKDRPSCHTTLNENPVLAILPKKGPIPQAWWDLPLRGHRLVALAATAFGALVIGAIDRRLPGTQPGPVRRPALARPS